MSSWASAEELEHKQLLATIANIERNMAVPASREVSALLLTYLNSLKARLGALEERKKAFEEKKERTESLQRVAVMVERETALNAAEKEQYQGFLQKEYFTKSDFSSLEQFYSNTWDRLTEGGKAEMSHRVWEGVRREEYRFTELPETVKEKEAQRLRDALGAGNRDLEAIPETDRSDFINSWDAGRKKESYQVLDRPSFAKSVSVSAAVVPEKAAVNPETRKETVVENEKKVQKPDALPQSVQAKASRQDLKLEDMPDISLTAIDVKAPLSNHKKTASSQTKGH